MNFKMSRNFNRPAANKVADYINRKPIISTLLLLATIGIFYVGTASSPSSYGIVLDALGRHDLGPTFGTPRYDRGDEWATFTPMTQAAVRSGFNRYNQVSFYHEDMRMLWSLPISDWGLIFKPAQWLYFITDAATAFSFQYYFYTVAFVLGYMWMSSLIGLPWLPAFALAAIAYFGAFTQAWWTVLAPVLAIFPWLIVISLLPLHWCMQFTLFFYTSVIWLIGFFYPPCIIVAGTTGAALILGYRKGNSLWRLVSLGVAGALGCAVACFYLQDYLQATWLTRYPGQRRLNGGSVVVRQLASIFFPLANFNGFQNLTGANFCEISTLGSYYNLLALCFVDYSKMSLRRLVELWPLFIPLAMMGAWMLLPLPAWVGNPLLWNFVQPHRMVYSAGLFMLLLSALATHKFGIKCTPVRLLILSFTVLAGWWYFKCRKEGGAWTSSMIDLLIIIPAWGAWIFKRWLKPFQQNYVFLGSAAILGFLAFGGYNPLQSASPIFHTPDTPLLLAFERSARLTGGILRDEALPGSVLSGLGIKSLNHVLVVPHMNQMHELYPDLPAAELDEVFNRYAAIVVSSIVDKPTFSGGVGVLIPGKRLCDYEALGRSDPRDAFCRQSERPQ